MERRVTASGLILLGAVLLTREHLWADTEIGLLYIFVGVVTLGLWFVAPQQRVTTRIAGTIVGAWVALATTFRVSAVLDDRPYLSVTEPTFWKVSPLYLDTELLVGFVAALILPFAVGGRRVRSVVAAMIAGLYVVALVRHGSGGFGFRFNFLFYSGVFAAGVFAGVVAAVPVLSGPDS